MPVLKFKKISDYNKYKSEMRIKGEGSPECNGEFVRSNAYNIPQLHIKECYPITVVVESSSDLDDYCRINRYYHFTLVDFKKKPYEKYLKNKEKKRRNMDEMYNLYYYGGRKPS